MRYCTQNCCYEWLDVENATLAQGTTATITTTTTNLSNKQKYKMCYCICFTGATGAEILNISNGETTYPVWDKNGEPVKIGRLRKKEMLILKFINSETAHFTIESSLYPLCLKIAEDSQN